MIYNTASEPENPIQGNTGEKTMNEEQLKHQNLEIMLKDMIVILESTNCNIHHSKGIYGGTKIPNYQT
jgi:hypothetical protein